MLGEEIEGAEVLVVSPATNQSKVAFWVSDSDEAIEEAEDAQEETVERLEEEGVDAAGDTGESEPAVAIQDALATFAADRIVVFTIPRAIATTARTRAWPTPSSASASPSRTRSSNAERPTGETDRSVRPVGAITNFPAAPFSGSPECAGP